MDSIFLYLSQGSLPQDRTQVQKLQKIARWYAILKGILYKKSYNGPWLKCATPEEGIQILQDIYEGLCGTYSGSQALAKKTMLLKYYWPTVSQD